MNSPKFHTKTGKLTAYALACGYVERLDNNWKLYRDGCFHLQRSNREWLTFGTLTEARKAYAVIKRTRSYVECLECHGTGEKLGGNLANGLTKHSCMACNGNGNNDTEFSWLATIYETLATNKLTNEGATK